MWQRFVAGGACVAVLAGCGGAVASSLARGKEQRAVITGVIRFVGGPRPSRARLPAPGQVTVFTPAGRAVAHQDLHGWGHHFRFVLRPGDYLLNVGRTMKYKPPYNCRPVRITARRGEIVRVVVHSGCGIP